MGSEGLHEDASAVRSETIERHRCIVSIIEELDAVDWYQQRVDACRDPELAAVLAHNRDEEKEHAAMALEWLRRHDPEFDRFLRQYLFTEGSIVALEDAATDDDGDGDEDEVRVAASALGIGSLRHQKG